MTQSLEQDIKTLTQHESFARFIETIYSLREEAIAAMHETSTENLQQISGQILTYDQILQMVDWNNLQLKHTERLRGHL
tara:strand:- start:4607 stop:4843 length:237 start_codon:yes stop_codon:yes gene_type:complete